MTDIDELVNRLVVQAEVTMPGHVVPPSETMRTMLMEAAKAINQLKTEHLRTKGSLAIATNALSHTESQLAEWRSKAGELENENRRLKAELEDQKAECATFRHGHRVASDNCVRLEGLLEEARKDAWEPKFEAIVHEQEQLAVKFSEEIAGKRGEKPSLPDPVRLLEMAEALYLAERNAARDQKG
jgi:chromosome segregation ATPase